MQRLSPYTRQERMALKQECRELQIKYRNGVQLEAAEILEEADFHLKENRKEVQPQEAEAELDPEEMAWLADSYLRSLRKKKKGPELNAGETVSWAESYLKKPQYGWQQRSAMKPSDAINFAIDYLKAPRQAVEWADSYLRAPEDAVESAVAYLRDLARVEHLYLLKKGDPEKAARYAEMAQLYEQGFLKLIFF